MRFLHFMNSMAGRATRVVAGAVLITAALFIGGAAGWIIGIVGLIPLAAGFANVCLLAPFFHAPLHGHSGAA